MRTLKRSQKATVLTLVLALGVAVYLNWEYARGDAAALVSAPEETTPVADTAAANVTDQLAVTETAAQADKNYGEAQLVSVTGNSQDFFEQARLSRTKTRDEALDTLQKSLKSAKLTQEEKNTLTQQLAQELDHITAENEIETLIKAKGFVDCVTFISGDEVNVTVMSGDDGLDKKEVAQIRDVILSKCSVSAQNITVVEVK